MDSLIKIMEAHQGRRFFKVRHYIDVYERFFASYRNRPLNVLEIGVFQGGSLQIWKKYFGNQAQIFGLDIKPQCKNYEEDRIKIFIGDQADKAFMESLMQQLPKIDIIIDDGGHTPQQQINTIEVLYPHLAWDGLYVCEDCGTSYIPQYGGGLRRKGTYIEYMKDRIDELYGTDVIKDDPDNIFVNATLGVHFYNGIVLLEKKKMDKPQLFHGGVIDKEPDVV